MLASCGFDSDVLLWDVNSFKVVLRWVNWRLCLRLLFDYYYYMSIYKCVDFTNKSIIAYVSLLVDRNRLDRAMCVCSSANCLWDSRFKVVFR